MIGPSRTSYDVARARHQEHLSHASRIREIQQARRDGTLAPDRMTHRRLTVARLLAVATAIRTSLHL
jgi:hypothetical protein